MSQSAETVKPTVTITLAMFERIEKQRKTVAANEHRLDDIAEEHKDAKKAFDTSRDTLDALVSEMIRVVNGGQSDLPLFDNMTDHIARAEKDPVAQALLKRLLDHLYTNLNLLIVHGYTEAERAELTLYLDSLDARDQAHAASLEKPDAGIVVPEPLPEPAFLSGDAVATAQATLDGEAPTDEELEALLFAQDIQIMPNHKLMTAEQRRVVRAWSNACDRIKTEKGNELTFDDLPAPPSYVTSPGELLAAEVESLGAPAKTAPGAGPKKERAKRRSSATFENKPRVVKAKKPAKAKKASAPKGKQ